QVEKFLPKGLNFDKELNHVLLINNAGALGSMGATSTAESLQRTFALNVVSPLLLSQHVLKKAKAKRVTIVNISSGAAQSPYPGWMEYCSTKAGFLMASQVMWQDYLEGLYPQFSRCNIFDYAPGVVNTGMQSEIRDQDKADFPNIEKFQNLHESGQLVEADVSAGFILSRIENSRKSGYESVRYQA
ncbi:SDR family NAD(P)-dependent oxidoreductase, partial [Oligoflexaceae bacterium]|nr:SDR family NAD(P)-dependent oxidoreductase [Oligoflexaceae bacterium]